MLIISVRAGFHTRAVLVHQVFLKVLSLSPAEWAHFSTGRVFNLVTSDVETLQLLSQSIMNLISSPLRIIVRPALEVLIWVFTFLSPLPFFVCFSLIGESNGTRTIAAYSVSLTSWGAGAA